MTADEVRSHGDASLGQRADLKALIEQRAVGEDWVRRFYDSVRRAGGLSRAAATEALFYLNTLAPRGEHPARALPAQVEALRTLRRTRVVPAAICRRMLRLHTTGDLRYDQADLTIRDFLRAPLRDFPLLEDGTAPAGTAPDGCFTLIGADGMPRCYRIHTLPGSGIRVVQQITGERPSQRRNVSTAVAVRVMQEVAADVAKAARLYGEAQGRCSNCNSRLERTDQPGYPHGYGPNCWAALQATQHNLAEATA